MSTARPTRDYAGQMNLMQASEYLNPESQVQMVLDVRARLGAEYG